MSADSLATFDLPTVPEYVYYDEIDVALLSDPLSAAAHIVTGCAADTYLVYEQRGQWSVALGMLAELIVTPSHVVLTTPDGAERALPWHGSPLEQVAAQLAEVPIVGWRAYGWAGFELAYAQAGMMDLVSDEVLLHLVIPQSEVRLCDGRALIRSTCPQVLAMIRGLLQSAAPPSPGEAAPVDVDRSGSDEYCRAVAAAVREIQAGEIQKVVLSRVLPVEHPVDLVATYVRGRQRNTPSRSFLLSIGGLRAAGFSPEIVVEVDRHGWVSTQPLAGTRELVEAADTNKSLREDLLTDAKEIFEHAISVKVAYDELVDLCESGSVVVNDFMTVKERGSVQHLASSVSGQMPPGRGPWAAFAVLFPAVTASGVPKRAAYASIHRNESVSRGLYSGAVLTVDEEGSLDAALVLRTIFQRAGQTWLRAGAGIVEQSLPEREFEETCEKLRGVALHVVRSST